jgi:hypothetical protein
MTRSRRRFLEVRAYGNYKICKWSLISRIAIVVGEDLAAAKAIKNGDIAAMVFYSPVMSLEKFVRSNLTFLRGRNRFDIWSALSASKFSLGKRVPYIQCVHNGP